MTSEDSDTMAPIAPETDVQDDAPQQNETRLFGNPSGTRDELWQVQFDPSAAREVAARHLGRLIYSSHEDWSRYVFHENDPKA
jgi:hypothetical protein